MTFTLADYNDSVLRLATLPNILMTWALSTGTTFCPDEHWHGDFEVSEALVDRFLDDLKFKDITFNFLSGPWSDELASQIPTPESVLILAAETIYSPESTAEFVGLTVKILKRHRESRAIVAAKRFYFGVGGSVDGLKTDCARHGAIAREIADHGVSGTHNGVERALLEICMC